MTTTPNMITSPIAGLVAAVEAAEGGTVALGDTLIIVESMKMEIPVVVENPGTVQEISVRPGDVIREGDVIAILI